MPITSESKPKSTPDTRELAARTSHDEALPAGGYDPAFFDQLARIEDQHFWFRARNHLILRLARRISFCFHPGSLVLEVGCGTGNVLRVLERACANCTVVGLELWSEGLRHARGRSGAVLVQGDIRNVPFGRQFDLVGMFDVLEHIQEEQPTLTALWKCLAPGGRLLLTVPAHQYLWSYFDEAAHHCRRYSASEIRKRLVEAGFQVEFLSQFMTCIFPIVWIYRRMRRLRRQTDPEAVRAQTTDEFRIVPVVNQVLTALLTLEAQWLASGHRLPIGTSLVVVARRPT